MWVLLIICIVGIGAIYIVGKKNKKESTEVNGVFLAKEKLKKEKILKEAGELGGVVYPSQKKFHRFNCRHANMNGTPITIHTAKSIGLKPCKKCNPHLLQADRL